MTLGASTPVGFDEVFELAPRAAATTAAPRSIPKTCACAWRSGTPRSPGMRFGVYRMLSAMAQRRVSPGAEVAVGKLVGAHARRRRSPPSGSICSVAHGVRDRRGRRVVQAVSQHVLASARSTGSKGGTDEVLRNILAERGTGPAGRAARRPRAVPRRADGRRSLSVAHEHTAPRHRRAAFRNALGAFTTGVTIVTTRDAAGPRRRAHRSNSFNSVSLEPPLVLWSLARSSGSLAAFVEAEFFAVHILGARQEALSNLFAQRGADKFAGIGARARPWRRAAARRLRGALRMPHRLPPRGRRPRDLRRRGADVRALRRGAAGVPAGQLRGRGEEAARRRRPQGRGQRRRAGRQLQQGSARLLCSAAPTRCCCRWSDPTCVRAGLSDDDYFVLNVLGGRHAARRRRAGCAAGLRRAPRQRRADRVTGRARPGRARRRRGRACA